MRYCENDPCENEAAYDDEIDGAPMALCTPCHLAYKLGRRESAGDEMAHALHRLLEMTDTNHVRFADSLADVSEALWDECENGGPIKAALQRHVAQCPYCTPVKGITR